VLQQTGWQGHASDICKGSNQIIANWVDHQAIRTSKNANGDGWCSCTGDFWVDGGAANAGKYEGADGVWRTPPATGIQETGPLHWTNTPSVAGARFTGLSLINFSIDHSIPGLSEMYSLRGSRIARGGSSAGVAVCKASRAQSQNMR
jgi:hypothetical protein